MLKSSLGLKLQTPSFSGLKICVCLLVFLFVCFTKNDLIAQKKDKNKPAPPSQVILPALPAMTEWEILDTSLKVIIKLEADSFRQEGNLLIRYIRDKQQIIYPNKIETQFSSIKHLHSEVYEVKNAGRYGLIRKNSMEQLPSVYDSIQYDQGFYILHIDKKIGLADSNFKNVLPVKYDLVKIETRHNYLFYRTDTTSGFIKINTFEKVNVAADSLSILNDSTFLKWKNKECLVVNKQFNPVFKRCFRNASQVSDTLIMAFDFDSLYYLNPQTKTFRTKPERVLRLLQDTLALVKDTTFGVHHFISDSIYHFYADTVWDHPQIKYRFLTKQGPYLGLASYEGDLLATYNRTLTYIGQPENDFMKVISKKKYGFIDTSGRMYFGTMYDSVKTVIHGHAAIKLKGKWGYASRKESILIQPNYSNATGFLGETAPVWIGNQALLVDNKGKELFKPRFDYIWPSVNYWVTEKRKLYGFLQTDGKEIYNPRFSKVIRSVNGYYVVVQYDNYGILNEKLELIYPFQPKEIVPIKGSDYFAIKVK